MENFRGKSSEPRPELRVYSMKRDKFQVDFVLITMGALEIVHRLGMNKIFRTMKGVLRFEIFFRARITLGGRLSATFILGYIRPSMAVDRSARR